MTEIKIVPRKQLILPNVGIRIPQCLFVSLPPSIYLNAGTGYDWAGHNSRATFPSRDRITVNSSFSFIFGATLPMGSGN